MSSLSKYDKALLVAHYNSLYKRETIDPKIFENRTEAEIKYLRKTMGTVKNISCDLEFNKDYKEFPEYPYFNFAMLSAFTFNKSGNYAFPGSLSEQPAKYIEILETIMQLDSEREEDARRQAERKKKNG